MNVIASDLSPYAIALTRAKLFPIPNLNKALEHIEKLSLLVGDEVNTVDLRKVPKWVRSFYHMETLREAIAWSEILKRRKSWFLFGCFLNLLHHQRPGFLSYPASHATPYLRSKKFPQIKFPEMYEYRDIKSRLLKKVCRTLKAPVEFDYNILRIIKRCNASNLVNTAKKVDSIITSPPYMSGLHYARDNRLRLWFCGVREWSSLETRLSPTRYNFSKLINNCIRKWQHWVRPKGYIAIVLGDIHCSSRRIDVARLVQETAKREGRMLDFVSCEDQAIPDEKRLIKGNAGTITETTLIFRRKKNIN